MDSAFLLWISPRGNIWRLGLRCSGFFLAEIIWRLGLCFLSSRCSDPIPRGSFSCSALLTASPCHQNLSLPPSRKYLAARSPCSTFLPWIFPRENYLAARSCVLSSRCSDPIPRGSFSCSVLLTASPRHQNPFQLPWQLSLNSHLLPRSPRIRKQSSRLTTPPSSMIKALSGCGVKFSKNKTGLILTPPACGK